MIAGRNIICFASGWHYHPTSKHHVMRQLAAGNHIIWVNWHASRCPRPGLADLRSMLARLGEIRRGPTEVSDSMTVLTPPQLPLPGSSLARRMNVGWVQSAIQRVLTRLPQRPVQIWSFAPDVADLVGCFNEELVLYYCVDAFGQFPGYNPRLIECRERELLERSDVVITTSPPLYQSHRTTHPNVHFVQHGVDHAHLARAVHEDLPVPPELRDLPRPIYGFVGMIGEWVDLSLVADLAERHPHASIVLIGPETAGRGECGQSINVRWPGPRDHELLPQYLRHFDVGLIPFRHVPLTHNANPIKLYEYLAAGVPTVSTTLPAIEAARGSVWLADDGLAMAQACEEAVQANHPRQRLARSNSMLPHSWTSRLEQISGIVHETIEAKRDTSDVRRETLDVRREAGGARPGIREPHVSLLTSDFSRQTDAS